MEVLILKYFIAGIIITRAIALPLSFLKGAISGIIDRLSRGGYFNFLKKLF